MWHFFMSIACDISSFPYAVPGICVGDCGSRPVGVEFHSEVAETLLPNPSQRVRLDLNDTKTGSRVFRTVTVNA